MFTSYTAHDEFLSAPSLVELTEKLVQHWIDKRHQLGAYNGYQDVTEIEQGDVKLSPDMVKQINEIVVDRVEDEFEPYSMPAFNGRGGYA